MTTPSEAQNVIAEVVRAHTQADEYGYLVEECCCGATFSGGYADHLASEVDKTLGVLTREYLARHASGGGSIKKTAAEARQHIVDHPPRPSGVDDPPNPGYVGVETRWVSGWSEA
ncbi:hypothetical protein FDI59_gp092 [Mycobacterium phage Yoshi]|uniref:Uncharacterized protein n=1 Tax=Mycobacterium phage Yoshi TaxID=2920891 RepID=G1BSJ9_9CAUD|nr:hypothetical protein FDI59_gp092 [Mycobacterium phage Yoshi]AEK07866.1 hypothetical protein YOSHI_92 [Mycobacterium phage Yoshi]